VIGEREFWSIPFTVSPSVLIPRPESELLVERTLDVCRAKNPLIIDIGTGSGCLAVSLAKEIPSARVVATDISGRALQVAKANAARHGVSNITFLQGRTYGPLRGQDFDGRAEVIVSNPPYVAAWEWPGLPEEVRASEPRRALVPGPTGFEVIQRLIRGAPRYLKRGGRLVVEIGAGQADGVRPLFGRRWDEIEISLDLGQKPRVVSARFRA
jgi:release factor glutamine methyltransferase